MNLPLLKILYAVIVVESGLLLYAGYNWMKPVKAVTKTNEPAAVINLNLQYPQNNTAPIQAPPPVVLQPTVLPVNSGQPILNQESPASNIISAPETVAEPHREVIQSAPKEIPKTSPTPKLVIKKQDKQGKPEEKKPTTLFDEINSTLGIKADDNKKPNEKFDPKAALAALRIKKAEMAKAEAEAKASAEPITAIKTEDKPLVETTKTEEPVKSDNPVKEVPVASVEVSTNEQVAPVQIDNNTTVTSDAAPPVEQQPVQSSEEIPIEELSLEQAEKLKTELPNMIGAARANGDNETASKLMMKLGKAKKRVEALIAA